MSTILTFDQSHADMLKKVIIDRLPKLATMKCFKYERIDDQACYTYYLNIYGIDYVYAIVNINPSEITLDRVEITYPLSGEDKIYNTGCFKYINLLTGDM